MVEKISSELNSTKTELLGSISAFPDKDFNIAPSENSWSAAQTAEHIFKSLSGVLELLHAPPVPTTRDPGEKVGSIRDLFLDFTIKMQSPEFVLPGGEPIAKDSIYAKLEQTLQEISDTLMTTNLTLTNTGFELPGFGPFTRVEWIWFGIYHTQRHTRQIKNILAAVNEQKQLST